MEVERFRASGLLDWGRREAGALESLMFVLGDALTYRPSALKLSETSIVDLGVSDN